MRLISELFHRHGVEFIVIGGQAETLFGSPRVTYDVDVCYLRTKENLSRLAAALQEINPTLRGAPPDLPFKMDLRALEMGINFTLSTRYGDLDILGFVEPLGGYTDLMPNSEIYPAYGLQLRTIGLEDLLKVKLHINRVKDQESIIQLTGIKRIRDQKLK